MTETPPDIRAQYIGGLHAIADLLEANPDLPLPGGDREIKWGVYGEEVPQRIVAIARRLPCALTANDPAGSHYDYNYYTLTGKVGGIRVRISAQRPEVTVTPAEAPGLHPLLAEFGQ